MTGIAIWRNDETEGNPSLWAAADSLVSRDGSTQLIGDAVKIFPLPIVCRCPDGQGFFTKTYFSHTLGYCFAGSTLMGQNAYLGLAPLLSNIISHNSYVPSMSDIARQILAYLSRTFDDYKSVGAHNALFEVALFGHCPKSQRPEIFHFHPTKVDRLVEMSMTAHQDLKTHDFVYLGDTKPALEDEIASAFAKEDVPGRPSTRAARYVIEDHISDPESKAIGGDLQLAIADKFGFRPLLVVRPYKVGHSHAYPSYLGRELTDDLIMIGEARIAINGMT